MFLVMPASKLGHPHRPPIAANGPPRCLLVGVGSYLCPDQINSKPALYQSKSNLNAQHTGKTWPIISYPPMDLCPLERCPLRSLMPFEGTLNLESSKDRFCQGSTGERLRGGLAGFSGRAPCQPAHGACWAQCSVDW